MLNPQVRTVAESSSPTSLCALQQRPLKAGAAASAFVLLPSAAACYSSNFQCSTKKKAPSLRFVSRQIKAALATAPQTATTTTTVKSVVTVKKITGEITSSTLSQENGAVQKLLRLELASNLLDPHTGEEKPTISAQAILTSENALEEIYEATFQVPSEFGEIGAIIVDNYNNDEKYVKDVVLDGTPGGSITVSCNSWVQPKTLIPTQKRVFFTNKSYLPSQTPGGLRSFRETELENLRGNGTGERQKQDRIYDYDVYNDLGNPDVSDDLKRPVLGGPQRPYPRRCRTGRPHAIKDPESEQRAKEGETIYVPRDEVFSDVKEVAFKATTLLSTLRSLLPRLQVHFDPSVGFPNFKAIDALFDVDGFKLPPLESHSLKDLIPWIFKVIYETGEYLLRFQSPEPMDRDKFFWLRDKEFARQAIAGQNPCCIELVREWPLTSHLDPEIYGPPESKFDAAKISKQIGSMTVEEAIQQKKLFMLGHFDVFLSNVQRVRALKGTTLYGSRTLFFLDEDETLRPIAIELVRPPMDGKPQWSGVFEPSEDATKLWLWRLAKAHVIAHDAGYHQLVSHWLKTHCAVEPYAIATHRQLSAMHPIYRLLHPHFRYTLEINASARSNLINGGGTIESTFSPLKYSMELSAAAYGHWQFDKQGLPADLIDRGIAEEDPTAAHGLKLHIKDYPYANDGLLLWDALKQWVTDYVNHYYPDPYLVKSDTELQAWWTEIRTVGHGDKKDEPWWPVLNTPKDLIDVITNMVWVASAYHAAVNFGQYPYAGYFPNRPTIVRTNMPTEDPNHAAWRSFLEKPEDVLLKSYPTQYQATQVMLVLNILSSHSPDEEYIGKSMEPSWGDNPVIKDAFERFSEKMKELEVIVDHRNADCNLKNRSGAGVTPYQLLKPFSGPGVTGKGVPNSISI